MDLFLIIRKTGEFVISTILTILQKKGEGDIPKVGVISTGTAGFARMEGSSEVASSVLNNFHPLVVTLSLELPCNVFYHRITQRGQQGRDADVDDRDNEDWRWSLNKKKESSSLRVNDLCFFKRVTVKRALFFSF